MVFIVYSLVIQRNMIINDNPEKTHIGKAECLDIIFSLSIEQSVNHSMRAIPLLIKKNISLFSKKIN